MPSFNEHTGARISSGSHVKGTDKEKFDSGWDAIFGKKEITVMEETPSEDFVQMTDVKVAEMTGQDEPWTATFHFPAPSKQGGSKDCYYCDYGDFPCNQNCVAFYNM